MNETPTFNILQRGERKTTLIHCFLHRMTITVSEQDKQVNIRAKNKEVYSIVWDFPLPLDKQEIPVIISFQKHTYGNFAIIRAAHPIQPTAEITFLPLENQND